MPSGVYERSKLHKQRIGNALRGRSKSFRTVEHCRKLSEARIKDWKDPEVRKKRINSMKHREPWNKGLTKESNSVLAEVSKKVSKALEGTIPWNKGKSMINTIDFHHFHSVCSGLPENPLAGVQLKHGDHRRLHCLVRRHKLEDRYEAQFYYLNLFLAQVKWMKFCGI